MLHSSTFDYARLSILPETATVIMLLPAWLEDYDTFSGIQA
jgi:hypothetical protein